ncbi:MAG: type II toxin-antitoxin system VapC family toxin [Candidatus Rokubacteria bacterium]|nr:type II toxin-antitoxin system VapC family toxin [Candidatus Rokubacteria bacterium]
MTGWLLDTVVVSELRKPRCDPRVKRWSDQQVPESLFLSRVTLAEIRFGIEQVADVRFRRELVDWLDRTLRPWFGARILDVDEEVIVEWRRMVARGRAVNHTFCQPDLFIAATAAVHGLTVVTRNVTDFQIANVPVVDPWRPEQESQGP